MTDRKSLILTYLFSLTAGVFGLHHLYLGRTQHAILWCTTFGGFGLGFLYEFFFSIYKYVQEANEDQHVLNHYKLKMLQRKSPSFEIRRFCGQLITSIFYGFITYYAFPDNWHKQPLLALLAGICTVLAIAVGTQMVGTLGPRQCSFLWPLLGALFGLPLIVSRNESSSPSFNLSAFLCSIFFEWQVEWNPTYFSKLIINKESQCSIPPKRKRRHFVQRCLVFGLGIMIFGTVFTSAVYQNLQVDIKGRRVKVKDVLSEFFKSQEFLLLYQQILNILRQLWTFYLRHGLKGIWTKLWMVLDSESEKQAYETLNLQYGASQKQIESQCRALSRQWHPDRHRDPKEKQNAESIFMNIQQACDRLSTERQRRHLLNTQKRENP
ncbi:unnamed protein product [Adineta ricciae]|uniref:DnaJ homolog subfamily C member 22 n=1 Tax=Adineta ricciae TaxID=249248 RepID=A0A814WTF8_ADIRI|nr:unnamed protein product [Adineta ricciae]CAF1566409.1 unnamed protein product [Adineta ricciae]